MAILTAPNINQITSLLARMRDIREVQNYAAMHKTDPYIMSLASSEVNRRKEAEITRLGQAGQQQLPKVNDQIIAGMSQGLPEDSGIAQLPTGPMQYADGGIVAFAGDAGSSVQDTSPDAINERYRQKQLQNIYDLFGATGVRRGYQSGMTSEEKQDVSTTPQTPPVSTTFPDMESRRGLNTAPAVAPPETKGPEAPPETKGPGIGALLPAASRSSVATSAPAGDYMTRLAAARDKQGISVDPFDAQRQGYVDTANTGATTALEELKAEQAARGIAGQGQEARIAKRETKIAADTNLNEALAFIAAGASIAGDRGRGVSGIVGGLNVGAKQYGEGIAKIRLAQEKADEARDKLDELRRNESTMNAREKRAANADKRNTALLGKKFMLDGLVLATGLDRGDITAAISSDIKSNDARLDRVSKEKMNAATVGATKETNALYKQAQTDQRNSKQAQDIRKNLAEEISKTIFDPVKREAEINRRYLLEIARYPNLRDYLDDGTMAGKPPAGSGSGTTVDFMTGKPI